MSGVRDFFGFFKRSKSKDGINKDGIIVEKNKKVDRWKEEYPITSADYTQYRWRFLTKSKKRKTKKPTKTECEEHPSNTLKHNCDGGCSCELVKEYTRAKESGDLLTIQQIRNGTFRSEKDKIGESALHPENVKSLVGLTIPTEEKDVYSESQNIDNIKIKASELYDKRDSLEQAKCSLRTENMIDNITSPSSGDQHEIVHIKEEKPHYYEENENTINHIAQQRQDAKRQKSLRHSFRRKVSKLQKNTMEMSKKRRNYSSLDSDQDSDAERLSSDVSHTLDTLTIKN